MYRFLVVFAAASAAFAIPVKAANKDAVLHLTGEWHVALDASGKVTALVDEGKLEAGVRDPLERAIRGWSFVPGKVDGKPARTETTLTLDVSFLPKPDGNYNVRIDDARTGGGLEVAAKLTAPRLPRDVAHPGFVGRVVVRADYDSGGTIVRVTPQADQSLNAPRSLDAATVKAVRQWKVVPEQVAGHGVAASVMLPICYTVSNVPPPEYDCAWTPPASKSKVDNDGAFALAPAAKLATNVIGRML